MDEQQQAKGSLKLSMSKGDGEESYSKNSGFQAFASKIPLSVLNEALERVSLPSEKGGPVVVADLGSSSGPNAITNVALIIDKLRTRLPTDAEFQVYFTDLPANDFNNLFQLLSNDSRAKGFHAAGVPGSFTDRLFPKSSVHVFYSALCVHWLSKIPDAVLDKDSSAYNKGGLWYMNSRSAVAKSYQQQSSEDLKSLLQARAAELVPGGLLFFFCLGRQTAQPNDPSYDSHYEVQQDLEEAWRQLIGEGLLTEEELDNFNIPAYCRSVEDVQEAVESCGSLFRVLTTQLQPCEITLSELFATSGAAALSKKYGALWKAMLKSLLEAQVGEKGFDVLFQRYEKLVERRMRMTTQDVKFTGQLCIVALMRS